MKSKFKNPLSRFIVALLGLLGFLTACESADLYGSPYASFKLNGTVSDKDQKPISNAQVSISSPRGYSYGTQLTQSDGTFLFEERDSWPGNQLVVVTTCDGYQKDSTVLEMQFTGKKKKDEWYAGHCDISYNPVLQKIEELEEKQNSENNN